MFGSSILQNTSKGIGQPWEGLLCVVMLSRVRLFAIPWTGARQALLSMGFSRQEYWNELRFPSQGDLLVPG